MFFPIGDDNPRRTAPLATGLLIAINVAVFAAVNLRLPEHELEAFFLRWGFDAAHPVSVQVVTSMFLHGGFLHLASNLWMLWIVGDNVEDRLGRPLYVLLYLVAGFAATSVYTAIATGAVPSPEVFERFGREHPPLVGASGAIFGIMGMYLVFFPGAQIRVLWVWFLLVQIVRWPAWLFLGLSLVMDFFVTALSGRGASGGVATAAHVGGGVFGIIAALFAKPFLAPVEALPAAAGGAARASPEWHEDPLLRRRYEPDPGFAGGSALEDVLTNLVRSGDVRRAIDVYPGWRARHRRGVLPADVQIQIAHEYYRQGLPKDALEAYACFLDAQPRGRDAAEAAFRIGVLHSQGLRDPAAAAPWLRRAAETHPDPRVVEYARNELRRIGA